ncbi:DUF4192 domain-containing protein [Streptomyces sp. SLBN-115]|uniref:DUF4192 domain-containing protein n=1 Tax=Streptomyces sp. SLBN-115 TaxID=2768453 RepID=UPI0011514587|nr:DUF4192 domain-containing protein [Streptomyces sp. SLBN-115]TQJ56210.1 uncharacterized protein DUF4192 [Streptomyces sp. SLBN-115]
MTNHSETTGSSENGDITGRDGREHPARAGRTVFEGDIGYGASPADHQVTLRTPAELADALPYLLGYRPEDSIVLVALHDRGGRGRFGGRARLGIPANPDDWGAVAQQLTQGLVKGSERRGTRPASMVVYLCQEPGKGETGRQVMERLQPLAHRLRLECGRLDVPVIEALCIADGRFWSYCCGGKGCCPVEGVAMGLPGTSVLAAAATYAGIQVRGTLRELRARLLPLETGAALEQEIALDTAGMALLPRILDEESRAAVAEETMDLAGRIVRRLAEAPVVPGALPADRRDDELLGFDEAAALILGLQDRATRDRAAGWMEGDEAAPALRLWRALARRCVGPYAEHAAAPLTLAGWVAWSTGDELEAREALAMALGADPDYLFARLLHQACNEGLDPESVRRCLRAEREGRGLPTAVETPGETAAAEDSEGPQDPGGKGFPAGLSGTARGEAPTDLRCPDAENRPREEGCPELGSRSGEEDRSSEPNDADGSGGAQHEDRPGEAEHEDQPGEVKGRTSGGLPHAPATCASESVPVPAPTTARRRRRVRPTAVGAVHARAAAGAAGGQEPETRTPGTHELRAHTPRPHVTRPAAPSRGGSRTRPAGKASTRHRENRPGGPEGLRSDSDDTTGQG